MTRAVIRVILFVLLPQLIFAMPAKARYYVPKPHHRCRAGYVRKSVHVRRKHHWVRQVRCVRIKPEIGITTGATLPTTPVALRPTVPTPTAPDPQAQQPPPFFYGPPVAPDPNPPEVGVGNVPGCDRGADPGSSLRAYNAKWLRVVVSVYYSGDNLNGSAATCMKDAVGEGARVQVVLQWSNCWTPAQAAAWVSAQLAPYARYASAVALGNEQEIQVGCTTYQGDYAADWKAAEPIVAQMAPNATRIGGEVSPWGLAWLQYELNEGLPGIQVAAVHVYIVPDGTPASQMLAAVNARGLPVWFDEGLSGPGSWGDDLPLPALAGGEVAMAWL